MRLIDADALKEATKRFADCDGFNPIWQMIDNVPTIEIITEEMAIDKLNATGWMQAHDKAMAETNACSYASKQRAYKEGKYKGFMMNPYGED